MKKRMEEMTFKNKIFINTLLPAVLVLANFLFMEISMVLSTILIGIPFFLLSFVIWAVLIFMIQSGWACFYAIFNCMVTKNKKELLLLYVLSIPAQCLGTVSFLLVWNWLNSDAAYYVWDTALVQSMITSVAAYVIAFIVYTVVWLIKKRNVEVPKFVKYPRCKKWSSVAVTAVAVILVISISFYIFQPLMRPIPGVEKYFFKTVPLGTSWDETVEIVENHEQWKFDNSYADIPGQVMYIQLGIYYYPFSTYVDLKAVFDDENKLSSVEIDRHLEIE